MKNEQRAWKAYKNGTLLEELGELLMNESGLKVDSVQPGESGYLALTFDSGAAGTVTLETRDGKPVMDIVYSLVRCRIGLSETDTLESLAHSIKGYAAKNQELAWQEGR